MMIQKSVQRIGIIGDVHGQDAVLAGALAHLGRMADLDRIVCTGDIIGVDGSIDACCHQLNTAGVLTVRGNHDRWYFETEPFRAELADIDTHPLHLNGAARTFLASLPVTAELATPLGRMLLCHGLGSNDMAGVYPSDEGYALEANRPLHALLEEKRYRLVVNGHTHRFMVRTIAGVTIVNAGVLQPDPQPCWAVADFVLRRVVFYRPVPGCGSDLRAESFFEADL